MAHVTKVTALSPGHVTLFTVCVLGKRAMEGRLRPLGSPRGLDTWDLATYVVLTHPWALAALNPAHVLVDHAEPCAWKQYTAAGAAVRPWVHIGRTMTESADLSPKWLACIRGNRVHEIWVPTPFHVELFARAGVHNAVAVPEAVDTDFFAPVAAAARQALPLARHVIRNPGEFVLVSVFKWEHRKGWDVLLDAYWAAFSRDDPVTLVLCSYVPGWEPGPARCRSYLCGKYAAT